ncbi:MAG TPA: DUF2306 domain-containing protein [Cellvibrio sp.]|nr:DUF2306 domain-containing protein [Cellvibrio sp.]
MLSVVISFCKYLFVFLALAIAGYALSYYWHGDNPFNSRYHSLNSLGVYSHFIGAGFALLLGALQVFPSIGSRWHRRLGYGYCLAVVIAAAGGLYLSFHAHLGLVTGLGFALADILWISFVGVAIYRVRQGDIGAHRRWMLRSMALTSAGISLRILLPLLCLALSFDTSYLMVAWLSWIGNLIAVEIYLHLSASGSSSMFLSPVSSMQLQSKELSQ